ncbi:MAG: alpha/beta hydrolase [Deltaproteobacteria bacterium]|nr:alpha/beta hydrolase [Deltaproteobacteria bacterium]
MVMGQITTNDGCRLHYQEAGAGRPLVLIHGWSQSGAVFKRQTEGLSDRFRVIALDMRGHGQSDKPAHGYRLSRLAKDVHDFLAALDLREVTLLGWSMGCSVVWSYWDLFGPERLSKIVLVDQAPWCLALPDMSAQERETAGSVVDLAGLVEQHASLRDSRALAFTEELVRRMTSPAMPEEERRWIVEENLKMPRHLAARLLLDHVCLDWRDVIPRINLPTLIIAGRASVVTCQSQVWIQQQIPGSRLEIFEEAEGGSHFMFLEGAKKFNQILSDFA